MPDICNEELASSWMHLPECTDQAHERPVVLDIWARDILRLHDEEVVRPKISMLPLLFWRPNPGPSTRTFLQHQA